ncbi:MAG: AraC family transcriptional regulator [Planctomycetia bacterium]
MTARRYFLDLRPTHRGPLTVVCGGEERVRNDYRVARDDFPYYCVEFVAAGRGTLTLDGRVKPLAAGSVFSYGPGIAHAIQTDRRHRLWKYYVDFVGRDATRLLRSARLAPGSHAAVGRPGEIRAIFNLLQQCGLAHSAHSQSLCSQLLGVLLTKLREVTLAADGVGGVAYGTFEAFRRFLAAHRDRLVSVEQAAAEFGISTAYACRLFRRYGTTSPYQELLRQRMTLAADLLAHDRLQVQQAAVRLGFTDASQFSRAFKRVAGVSPSAFQRRA